jgi:hypothetical protein
MNADDFPHGPVPQRTLYGSAPRRRPKRQSTRPKRLIEEANAPVPAPKRRKVMQGQQTLGQLHEQFARIEKLIVNNSSLFRSADYVASRSVMGAQTDADIAYTSALRAVDTCSRQVERAIEKMEQSMDVMEIELFKSRDWWSNISILCPCMLDILLCSTR